MNQTHLHKLLIHKCLSCNFAEDQLYIISKCCAHWLKEKQKESSFYTQISMFLKPVVSVNLYLPDLPWFAAASHWTGRYLTMGICDMQHAIFIFLISRHILMYFLHTLLKNSWVMFMSEIVSEPCQYGFNESTCRNWVFGYLCIIMKLPAFTLTACF